MVTCLHMGVKVVQNPKKWQNAQGWLKANEAERYTLYVPRHVWVGESGTVASLLTKTFSAPTVSTAGTGSSQEKLVHGCLRGPGAGLFHPQIKKLLVCVRGAVGIPERHTGEAGIYPRHQ